MAHGYCVANAFSGLSSSAFSESTAPSNTATRAYYNDGRLGRVVVAASSVTSQEWMVALTGATSLVGVALLNHNLYSLDPTATVSVVAADDSGFSSGVVTAKSASPLPSAMSDRKDLVLAFPAVNKRYWKIAASWSVAGKPSAGELFGIASITSLSRFGAWGSGEAKEVVVASQRTQSGDLRVSALGGPIHERRYSFADWSAAELQELEALWYATRGPVTPLLWIDSVDAASSSAATVDDMRCVYGRIQDARFEWTQDDFGIFQPPGMVIQSRGREMGA